LDAFQFRVGGDIFNVEVQLDKLIPLPLFKGWMVRFQIESIAPYMTGEPEVALSSDIIPAPETLIAQPKS
jgi:hypothetical protein